MTPFAFLFDPAELFGRVQERETYQGRDAEPRGCQHLRRQAGSPHCSAHRTLRACRDPDESASLGGPRMAHIDLDEISINFHVPARGNAGAVARHRLDLLAEQMDRATLSRVRLLVSELVNRAALEPQRTSVPVAVTISRKCVRATVRDHPDALNGSSRRLDWALFLVRRMSDRWGTASGVWFEIDHPRN